MKKIEVKIQGIEATFQSLTKFLASVAAKNSCETIPSEDKQIDKLRSAVLPLVSPSSSPSKPLCVKLKNKVKKIKTKIKAKTQGIEAKTQSLTEFLASVATNSVQFEKIKTKIEAKTQEIKGKTKSLSKFLANVAKNSCETIPNEDTQMYELQSVIDTDVNDINDDEDSNEGAE